MNFLQNWAHVQTQNNFQQIQYNWNNTLQAIWQPQIKAGYQQQQKQQWTGYELNSELNEKWVKIEINK